MQCCRPWIGTGMVANVLLRVIQSTSPDSSPSRRSPAPEADSRRISAPAVAAAACCARRHDSVGHAVAVTVTLLLGRIDSNHRTSCMEPAAG